MNHNHQRFNTTLLATVAVAFATLDVEGFASDMAAWQVEYVIFTAWHTNINPLFPSETMKKRGLPGHPCKRDLIGDVIKALKTKGIPVVLKQIRADGLEPALWAAPFIASPESELFKDAKSWNKSAFLVIHPGVSISRYSKTPRTSKFNSARCVAKTGGKAVDFRRFPTNL